MSSPYVSCVYVCILCFVFIHSLHVMYTLVSVSLYSVLNVILIDDNHLFLANKIRTRIYCIAPLFTTLSSTNISVQNTHFVVFLSWFQDQQEYFKYFFSVVVIIIVVVIPFSIMFFFAFLHAHLRSDFNCVLLFPPPLLASALPLQYSCSDIAILICCS